MLLARNRNYRLLFVAGALTNLGDGLILLALPWLATLMTSNPVAIATIAAALRLPWLLFALPAGVVIDRADRRKLIARADLLRAGIVLAILVLALNRPEASAIWVLTGLAFLLGSAEVLRDNAAQTILPDIVAPSDLEAANGQLWSAEQLTGQFIGPPLAGFLIALGIWIPFGLDVAMLVLAAGMAWLITLPPRIKVQVGFWPALMEGIAFMRRDKPLLRLAIVLGIANFLAVGTMTVQVLFAQEVLGMSSFAYGIILSFGAAGAIAGSLLAPKITRAVGTEPALFAAIGVWAVTNAVAGLTSSGVIFALANFAGIAAGMVWNVITVSWRQRRVPADLLGRVNSIYRFFGWGSMPLGALAGGAVVSLLTDDWGREAALRAPFWMAGACFAMLLVYGLFRLRLPVDP